AAPEVARDGDRLRQRRALRAFLRVPARAFALGRGARPRAGPGGAPGRQEGRRYRRARTGGDLRRAAALLRRSCDGDLLLGIPLRAGHEPRRAVARVPAAAAGGGRAPRGLIARAAPGRWKGASIVAP